MKPAIDFTEEIRLESSWQRAYRTLQFFLYLSFVVFMTILVYKILFPVYEFNYVFGTTGLSNNIINPYVPESAGVTTQGPKMVFNINQLGDFSEARINLTLPKNSTLPTSSSVTVQKSFQAFFNPTGDALGFKDGSLVTDGQNYFLVTDGELRKFSSLEIAQAFGLDGQAFAKVSPSDLKFNNPGSDISDSRSLVDNLIYKAENNYYQVRSGQLWLFTSEKAFLSQYDKSQAIAKDASFISEQTVSENVIGYADGTLATIGQSVIILSQGKYYPIDIPATFDGLGWNWNDVVQISTDELALYARQKQFSDADKHPDGTIFTDKETNKYYMLSRGQKLPLATQAIVNSYLKRSAVEVSSKSLTTQTLPCKLQKNIWPRNSYGCSVSLSALNQLIGNDFQFSLTAGQNVNPLSIRVELSTPANWKSVKTTLSLIRNSLRYTYTNQQ